MQQPTQEQPAQVRDFAIERPLGQGGMATVYYAKHLPSGRQVALKLMHPHLANDPVFVQRFLQEVRATTGLRHDNLVEVIACGEDAGRYYLATEFVDGGTVADLQEQTRKLPAAMATNLALQLFRGLDYAHEKGIVHRDIKPANLMLTRQGRLKVCDFGIAKTQGAAALTQTGSLIGTPAYMSPEQAGGKPIDARSDLFSAGVVFYELLTGINPYLGENESTTLLKVLKASPQLLFEVDPSVPPGLEAVLERLLERDPDRRYRSAAEVVAELAPQQPQNLQSDNLVAHYLANPAQTKQRLDLAQAAVYTAQARKRLEQGPGELFQACLDLYRALILAPSDKASEALFTKLCSEQKLSFAEAKNPKIRELEAALEQSPDSAGVLVQLASLYRLEGNIFKAAACYKRALKLRPNDGYVAGQLSILTGERPKTMTGTAAVASPAAGAPTSLTAGRAAAPRTGNLPSFSAANELHTGRTGQMPARRPPTAAAPLPSTAPAPATQVDEGEPSSADYARALWQAWGKKLVVAALLAAAALWVVRKIGKGVDSATEEASRSMELGIKAGEERARQAQQQQDQARADALARKHEDEAKVDLEAARALASAGQHEAAAEAFAKFVENHPKRPAVPTALFEKAKALLAAGRPMPAIEELENLTRDHPQDPITVEAQVVRAEALMQINRGVDCLTATTQFLALHEASPLAGRARLARARAELSLGDKDSARKDLDWLKGRYAASDLLFQKADELLGQLDSQ